MTELLRKAQMILSREPGDLIVFRRTSAPLIERDDLERFVDELSRLVPLAERRRLHLLQDMRDGPLLGDPELERALVALVPRMVQGFQRRAILVSTAVGRLQVARMGNSMANPGKVFTDEAAARAYLAGDDPEPPAPRGRRP